MHCVVLKCAVYMELARRHCSRGMPSDHALSLGVGRVMVHRDKGSMTAAGRSNRVDRYADLGDGTDGDVT
jgi:hypothetical protein